MPLIFVTSNQHKFEEARTLAEEYEIEIEQRDVPYIEIQTDNLADIVKPGAQQAYRMSGAPCFVEDAGLFINALNGFPGPYSSYVFKTLGNQGILRLLEGVDDRRAEFRSALGYCGNSIKVFEGKVKGTIAKEERGSKGFGYDPIFIPDMGGEGTFAEMSMEMKNALSHRANSIEKFVKWYSKNKKAEGG
ncbi:hypothetical protein AKJ37_01430 [candidate division MSBL1 archaeon SCGC-AAA259I09]|uniref:dITP/XTP pyrophosphatase n=4 Tax=candidate division MSBL1 TaxID=215777 RepID=A0A133UV63_9EURY|nr:hypothetical protein AKJ62_00565 [candidate division MSBL1 archaeon SCGC-AAA259D14]KXA98095.1 hypothetical protein AKJ37_01430 [candidate division MSBL1 archaeon SCGC-AAA259I09]KXA98610.1 hypothetical protein AKJ39_01490 [candidate division MSBL1 archaeon SCGC-AAA259J03]